MRCLCKEAVFMYCTTVRCLCKEASCTPRTAFKRRHDSLPRTGRPLSNSSEDTTASLQLIRGHDGLSPTHPRTRRPLSNSSEDTTASLQLIRVCSSSADSKMASTPPPPPPPLAGGKAQKSVCRPLCQAGNGRNVGSPYITFNALGYFPLQHRDRNPLR